MLLGKPSAESLLNFLLRNRTRLSRLQTVSNFLDYIKMILNVLERTVVRQLT